MKIDQRKKQLWIGGAVVAALYFSPTIVNRVASVFQARPAQVSKPSPYFPVQPANVPATPRRHVPVDIDAEFALARNAQAPEIASFPPEEQSTFVGVWNGTAIKNRNCEIHLELIPTPGKAGFVTGYETRICFELTKLPRNRNGQPTRFSNSCRKQESVRTPCKRCGQPSLPTTSQSR